MVRVQAEVLVGVEKAEEEWGEIALGLAPEEIVSAPVVEPKSHIKPLLLATT